MLRGQLHSCAFENAIASASLPASKPASCGATVCHASPAPGKYSIAAATMTRPYSIDSGRIIMPNNPDPSMPEDHVMQRILTAALAFMLLGLPAVAQQK